MVHRTFLNGCDASSVAAGSILIEVGRFFREKKKPEARLLSDRKSSRGPLWYV